MTNKTLEYAKSKGFKLDTVISAVNGKRVFLIKENVKILVESYALCDGPYERSDKDIVDDIDNFDELKKDADFLEEYEEETRRRMML